MSASYVLAIHPDEQQASLLRAALCERSNVEVVVAASQDVALDVIDRRIPDLVLVHAFMPPGEEADLVAHLRTLSTATHVQVISIPVLQLPAEPAQPKGLLGGKLKPRPDVASGCDPRSFAAEVAQYLEQAQKTKTAIDERDGRAGHGADRRRAYRWTPIEVPWVSLVQLAADEGARLINVSSGGALIRTRMRPWLTPADCNAGPSEPRTSVTFRLAMGQKLRAAARVIRCHVEPLEDGAVLYRVGLRFDESVALELPAEEPTTEEPLLSTPTTTVKALPPARSDRHRDVFGDVITLPNELRLVLANVPLSAAARYAIAKLASIDGALLQIGAALAKARRATCAEAALQALANRLAPSIRRLQAARAQLIGGFSDDDLMLIAAHTRRAPRALAASYRMP